jgi:transcriptional regulator with GAF, ATPase, and Fis domain
MNDALRDSGTVPVREPSLDGSLVAAASFGLAVIEGPNSGALLKIEPERAGPVLVGQSIACDMRLTDQLVSRRHASFELSERQLRLADVGSTNGTFVNGVSVVEALLRGGEVVRIGQTCIRVDLLAPASLVALSPAGHFGRMVGASIEMRRLYPLFERLAATDVPVVLEGETGTGKELLAESIHELGPRASGPFVVFDCTAVAPTLIESELFGHERGAFTGAVAARKGVFEQAHGGTLLIDEIGDLPAPLQPKLLRVLERSEIRRVGGDRTVRVEVRVLCATRRNLDREVQAGRFRDDLFHRLAVARIELPPLRRRKGDIPVLAGAFCRQMGGAIESLPETLLRAWEDYFWPGNIRELRNSVARRLALGDLTALEASTRVPSVPPPPDDGGAPPGLIGQVVALGLPLNVAKQRVIEELERCYIERVLTEHGGNITRAAAASGIARRQLQRVKGRVGR